MNLISFLSGIYMIGFAASGLIFLKFYRSTGDKFFRYFAYACWMLAAERIALFFVSIPFPSIPTIDSESESWIYIIRLVAFMIILFAIYDKNRKSEA